MSGMNNEAIVSKLRTLNSLDPQRAMDELEDLLPETSVKDLAQILDDTCQEISQELRIDWRFTAMQWKLGNLGREEFVEACPEARFKVWSFAFRDVDDVSAQVRYSTCLPFQLKAELTTHHMTLGSH
jgi:hypothetical protein